MQRMNFEVNYLSGFKVFKKDKDGKKTSELSAYCMNVIEFGKTKAGKRYVVDSQIFVNADIISEEFFDNLEVFDLLDITFEFSSMSSMDNKRVVEMDLVEDTSEASVINVYTNC